MGIDLVVDLKVAAETRHVQTIGASFRLDLERAFLTLPLRTIMYSSVPGLLVKIQPDILAPAGKTLTLGLLIASWALVTVARHK